MRIPALIGLSLCLSLAAAARAADGEAAPVFAKVGEAVITLGEYEDYLRGKIRRKFYHGTPPAPELARFQREVGDELVERTLLAQEAERRGLEPDPARIRALEARYEERFGSHPHWAENRERVLSRVRAQERTASLVEQLEEQVRDVPLPSEDAARRYYEQHPEKFTEPAQNRVSVILLKVDPSSTNEAWQEARSRAAELVEKLRAGADFAELARAESDDPSAANGGDMGYLHAGMLGDVPEKAIAEIEPGKVTDPVVLLEGIAVFRLEDRKPAALNEFADVRERAARLAQREQADAAWKSLVARLRESARIEIHEEHYLPLAPDAPGAS